MAFWQISTDAALHDRIFWLPMLPSVLVFGMLAMQPSSGAITPESACGPTYHEFNFSPLHLHTSDTTSMKDILSTGVAVEGTVISKRTYHHGGVTNDVKVRVTKPLEGPGLGVGDVITVHVDGGYAPDVEHNICARDTISDGIRIEVGGSYLISLVKEAERSEYRTDPIGSWFRIANNGDVIPLTPNLVNGRSLAGKKIADFEAAAREAR
jgi:hypothetical protein